MNRITTAPTRTRRRGGLIAAGIGAGALLAIAAPLAASAHVTVSPEEAAAGSYSVFTFAFSHGCEESPTTSLTINMPEGVESVAPQIEPGWTISTTGAEDGVADQVIYTADAPVPSGLRATVTVQVKLPEAAAGESVAFPVVQACVDGQTDWTEIAEAGEDPHDLDHPAPVVTVGDAAEDAHGSSAHASAEAEDADAATADTDAVEADPLARWLGAAGLAAGVAALVVVLVRGRSRKS